jgi:hypothetical protein
LEKEKKIRDRVEKDFPKDPALQEVHYTRLKIHEQTQGMSVKEYIEFIKKTAKKILGKDLPEITPTL